MAVTNGTPRLWIRPLDSLTARELPDTDGARFPFWSPDSSSIGFFTSIELRRIDVSGAEAVILARALDPAIWLLVGADALGVLHDVTATLGFARALGRPPDHVLLSASRSPDASTGTNAAELEALGIASRVFSARAHDAASLASLVDALLS